MRTVGALVYHEFELLDLFGPLEMFGLLPDAFAIRIVSREGGPVASAQGPSVAIDARLDARPWDILLVPGGPGSRREVEDRQFVGMLGDAAATAGIVAGVCTGSMLLAAAGVLDGKRATSNKLALGMISARFPGVNWRTRARWVEDGRIWTSSGVSAGLDMSLALIGRLAGKGAARDAARWAEYVPNTDAENDPFSEDAIRMGAKDDR